jgi:hypothetical protein
MESTNRQFGLMVAYLLPGFVGLGGIAALVPAVSQWLQPAVGQSGWDIAPPVYAVLAAISVGMILSCFRWLVLDHVHAWTGVTSPAWDVDRLEDRITAFDYLVEHHYRYYQCYANMLVAVIWTYSILRWMRTSSLLGPGTDLGVFTLCATLFAGSRDALSKYCVRTNRLIGRIAEKAITGDVMTNGIHPDGAATVTSKRPDAKPARKSQTAKQDATNVKVPIPKAK